MNSVQVSNLKAQVSQPLRLAKRCYVLLVICLLALVPAWSQSVTKVGTTAGQFLKIGVGARALGMGGAFTAVANDASTLYWNPAGISRLSGTNAIFHHSDWFLDINFEYAGIAQRVGNMGTIGAAITYLNMGEMLITTTRDPEGTSGEKFKAGSYAGALSFARNLTDRFSLGLTVKLVSEFIYNSSARAFAVDIGTFYSTRVEGLTLGMTISNFGSKMRMTGRDLLLQTDVDPSLKSDPEKINALFSTDRFDLPLLFRFGTAYDYTVSNLLRITVAIDAQHPNDNTESLSLGTELSFGDLLFVRGGYKNLFQRDSEEGLAFGAGVDFGIGRMNLTVDYAYEQFGRLSFIQKVTIHLSS